MQFSHTSSPIPLEGTLYLGKSCDPAAGLADNLNDTGGTTGSGAGSSGSSTIPMRHPAPRLVAGSNSSGCVDYTNAPDC